MDRPGKQKLLILGFIPYSGTDMLNHFSFKAFVPFHKMNIDTPLPLSNASQGYFL